MSEEYVLECTPESDCQGGLPSEAMILIASTGNDCLIQEPQVNPSTHTKPQEEAQRSLRLLEYVQLQLLISFHRVLYLKVITM